MDLSYPSVDSTLKASNLDNSVEQIFYIIKSCVKSIQFGDDIYNSVDITPKELDEFIDNLTQEQFKTFQEFFDTMPKLTHDIEVKNPKTGVTSEVHMEGLSDFLS
jgi:hypothetical protein